MPTHAFAGEVFGTVSQGGRASAGKTVVLDCGNSMRAQTVTDSYGGYRVSAPDGEQHCDIRVDGTGPVRIYTAGVRTRVNLDIVGRLLIRK